MGLVTWKEAMHRAKVAEARVVELEEANTNLDIQLVREKMKIEGMGNVIGGLRRAHTPRPMSTAPKEGAAVLAWTGEVFGYLIVMWSGSRWTAPDVVGPQIEPQFWYPLPAEPDQGGDEHRAEYEAQLVEDRAEFLNDRLVDVHGAVLVKASDQRGEEESDGR